MDETTIKILATIQVRLQVQMGALLVVLAHPIPGQPIGEQWGRLSREVSVQAMLGAADTVTKQIRLMAELFETTDENRKLEIVHELGILDQLIQAGLAALWHVPPRPTT